jgi:hypothetical protein
MIKYSVKYGEGEEQEVYGQTYDSHVVVAVDNCPDGFNGDATVKCLETEIVKEFEISSKTKFLGWSGSHIEEVIPFTRKFRK